MKKDKVRFRLKKQSYVSVLLSNAIFIRFVTFPTLPRRLNVSRIVNRQVSCFKNIIRKYMVTQTLEMTISLISTNNVGRLLTTRACI